MYTTLSLAKAALKTSSNTDDAKMLSNISVVTSRIRSLDYDFEPYYDTKYFTADPEVMNISTGLLTLRNADGQHYLLYSSTDVPTIVSDSVNKVWGTDILPYPQGNITPLKTIRLSDATCALYQTWYPLGQKFLDTIVITGWWGFRKRYASEGWLASGSTVADNPLSASATTVTTQSVGGADPFFFTPRFSAGNLIRVENELMQVYATDTALNTLSVQRGVRGTGPAVQHASGVSIQTWYPEPEIQQAASRQAALLYSRMGAFEQTVVSGIGITTYPSDLLNELWDVIQGLHA